MKHLRHTPIILSLSVLCMLGMAQPDPAREGAPPQGESRNAEPRSGDKRDMPRGRLGLEIQLDPEALRIRLQRLVEHGQDMAERGQSAIDKLDAGASASEVLSELRMTEDPRRTRSDSRNEGDTKRRGNDRPDERRSRTNTPDDRDAINQFIQAEFPELWSNIEPMLKQDPRNADRLLGRMAPQIREILALQGPRPELAKVKTKQMRAMFDMIEASRLYRIVLSNPDATQSERESALSSIRTHAEERFDAELRAKQLDIARLEARLDELRGSVAELEDRRDQEVDQMVTVAQQNAERLALQQAQRQQKKGSGSGSGDD